LEEGTDLQIIFFCSFKGIEEFNEHASVTELEVLFFLIFLFLSPVKNFHKSELIGDSPLFIEHLVTYNLFFPIILRRGSWSTLSFYFLKFA
jgi:hypothetical protein